MDKTEKYGVLFATLVMLGTLAGSLGFFGLIAWAIYRFVVHYT